MAKKKKKTTRQRARAVPDQAAAYEITVGVDPISTGIGSGFMVELFGGKDFRDCLIELLKNSRDWKATLVHILTNEKALLSIFDNGNGLNAANRNAFARVNMTTASGPDQAGKFDTGTKHVLFSFARSVKVITAPRDEPGRVYMFEFTASEYEQLAMKEEKLIPKCYQKNEITWPYMKDDSYGARFGTMLSYVLDDSRSQRIVRGNDLAKELTGRLPIKLLDSIFVDGQPLPEKEVIGKVFEVIDDTVPELGEVVLEIYRPQKRRSNEALRVTGQEIGEAPFSNLVRVLRDMRSLVEEVYTLKDVCGTISAAFLAEYANEDRSTIKAKIVDDRRVILLLKLLQKYAPLVQKDLRIKLSKVGDDEAGSEKEDIDDVASMYNARYQAKKPPTEEEGGVTGPRRRRRGREPNPKSPIQLKSKQEIEVGEVVEMPLILRGSLKGRYKPSDITWNFTRACGTVRITDKGIELTATDEGQGLISGQMPGNLFVARASYQVVNQRRLSLSVGAFVHIEQGAELTVFAKNIDKLSGDVGWKFEGEGEFTPDGKRAHFKAATVGSARIEAFDTLDPSVRAESEILVIKPVDRRQLWYIRNVKFTFEMIDSDMPEFRKPVTMTLGTSKTHRIKGNRKSPAWMIAKKKGTLCELLRDAVALEFARFARFELEDMDLSDFDGRDLPIFVTTIQTEGYVILEEILSSLK